MHRAPKLLLAALLAAGLSPGAAEAAPLMFLDVAGQGGSAVVDLGASFTAEVWIQDIPPGDAGNGLFGFGFDLRFDPSAYAAAEPVAEAVWTVGGTFLTSSSSGIIASRTGQTCGPFGTNCSLGTGVVRVATVELTALLTGVHALELTHLSGPGDNVSFDLTVHDEDASFFAGAAVAVVPEPAESRLVLLGLLALLARRGRRG